MYNRIPELLDKIRLGEDSYLELKEVRFSGNKILGPGRANIHDLEKDLWQRFVTQRTLDTDENLLIKLGMAHQDEDGVIRPTVTGILLGTHEPRQWLPNAFIQAVFYRGTDIHPDNNPLYQIDALDITGPLDKQIMAACVFVRKNMRIGAIKKEGRVDIPQYDMAAVFEAVVNAVAHRDYSIYGSKIRLRMFDNRLELYSPGTIPNTMTVDSLPYRQSARNETIASLLARCPIPDPDNMLWSHRKFMMDKRGEGVPIILQRSLELSGHTPEYRLLDDAELLLTIYSAGYV